MSTLEILRVYDPPSGGYRVLVDRLWPRGLTREDAALDRWAKTLAPSSQLRRWYHDDRVGRYDEFCARYLAELDVAETAEVLADLRDHERVCLLTSVTYPEHSHVPVLVDWLLERGFVTDQPEPDPS